MTPAELIQGYLENDLSDAEYGALQAWLARDSAHVEEFAVHAFLHSQLCDVLGEQKVCKDLLAKAVTEHKTGSTALEYVPAPASPRLGILARISAMTGDSLVVNAFMLFCVTVGAILTGTMVVLIALMIAGHRPAEKVAQLTNTANCQWVNEQTTPVPGDDLVAGCKLELNSGLTELVFQSGAKLLLQGPASFEIVSAKSGRLHHGSLAATCETPSSKGFEIDTPGMKYTDLGTEFGVMVAKDGVQEVHVFRGEVQAEVVSGQWPVDGGRKLESPRPQAGEGQGVRAVPNLQSPSSKPSSASLILSANQAIRIAAPGKPVERIAADEKRFVRTEQLNAQMTTQVAVAEENASRPARVVWKEIGEAPGVVGMAAVGGKLVACTHKKLMVCDPTAAKVVWKTISDDFTGVVTMGTADKQLFAVGGGELYMSDDVNSDASWKKIGHAWCIVGMAGAPGKIYSVVDTKEPGKDATIMVRDTVATDAPWNGTGCRPPVGTIAFTVVGEKFFAATKDGKLFVSDLTKPNAKWQPIGDAAGVIVLAGGDGKLFAATQTGKLFICEVK